MEEVRLTIPQVIIVIVLLVPIIIKMIRTPQIIEIEIPKEEVAIEEPVNDGWTGNGGALLYGHNRDMY
ncbi:hypothetical protein [Streptococcus sp. zg-JUN1979]|uniref:hypothetical protein n=1 Tax=Streptococcus sp. zg-JUN1979 TaxID=3391450 RepID=UPI0039A4F2DF